MGAHFLSYIKAQALKHPLLTTLREHPKAVGQLVGFTLLSTLCYYTFFSALTPFAVSSRGADARQVFWALSIATAMFCWRQVSMSPISGATRSVSTNTIALAPSVA